MGNDAAAGWRSTVASSVDLSLVDGNEQTLLVEPGAVGVFAPVFTFQGYRIADRPSRLTRALGWVLGAYWLVWVFVLCLTFVGARLDTYEMLAMGHEWQLVYWKHPALPPWIAEAVFDLTGASLPALSVLSVSCVVLALWLTWKLCRPIFGDTGAALAAALSLGSWYVMVPVGQFNHNLAQLPMWVLTVLCYRHAAARPSVVRWIVLALVAALLMETKYTGALLLVTLAVHALWFPDTRRMLTRSGPLAGCVLLLALCGTEIIYAIGHAPSAMAYATDRPVYHSAFDHILGPLSLLASQVSFHAAIGMILLAGFPFTVKQRTEAIVVRLPERSDFDVSLLIAATAGPLFLGLLFYGLSNVWGRPEAFGSMFILIGPSIFACYGRTLRVVRPKLVLTLFAVIVLGPPVGVAAHTEFGPRFSHRVSIEHIPFSSATEAVQGAWAKETGRPLAIIAGDPAIAGGFAAAMAPRPSVLLEGVTAHSPWITQDRIEVEGVLVVWRIKDGEAGTLPPELAAALRSHTLNRMPSITIHTKWDQYAAPPRFGLAVIRPTASRTRAVRCRPIQAKNTSTDEIVPDVDC